MKRNSILVYIAVSFFMIFTLIFFINQNNYAQKVGLILESKLTKLETHYTIFMYNQKVLTDNILDDTMSIQNVVEILEQASKEKNDVKLSLLRDELYRILATKYSYIKANGILQYHFILPNNISFLRMHKPSKYGDDLTNIRQDIEYVNKYKTVVRGFSNGRTAHGFRNVYPIFNKKNEYLGAIEISFSSESLQNYLINLSNLHSHFLIDKHVFDSKAWERDDMILKYYPSAENKNLMFHVTPNHSHEQCVVENGKNLKEFQDEIKINLEKNEKFVLYVPTSKDSNVISFYPVKQNVTNKVVAWIAAYEYVALLEEIKRQKNYNIMWSFIILLVIAYFINKLLFQHHLIKENEKKLIEKTHEQETL